MEKPHNSKRFPVHWDAMLALKARKAAIHDIVKPLKVACRRAKLTFMLDRDPSDRARWLELKEKIHYIYQNEALIDISKEITYHCRRMEGWHLQADQPGRETTQQVEQNDVNQGEV